MLKRSHAASGGINQFVQIYADHPTYWKCAQDGMWLAAARARLCNPAHSLAVSLL
jgi:hypothetical protein